MTAYPTSRVRGAALLLTALGLLGSLLAAGSLDAAAQADQSEQSSQVVTAGRHKGGTNWA